jgi:cytochrome c-type protein NrfB
MDNFKLTMVTMLRSILVLCLFGFSFSTIADEGVDSPQADSSRHKVELQRDPDYKCIQCHKDAQDTIRQSHGEGFLEKKGKNVTCTDCHGNIGPEHRVKADVVTTYEAGQSRAGTKTNTLSHAEILEENQQCTDCHTPERLQKANWTHDVHAKNLTCTNCHAVHGHDQGVLNYERKELIEMCVACHADFNRTHIDKE